MDEKLAISVLGWTIQRTVEQTCSIRKACPKILRDMSYLEDLRRKEHTLRDFHVCDLLPFVYRHKPLVSPTAAAKKVDLEVHEEDG